MKCNGYRIAVATILFILLTAIQLCAFTPYTRTETYISSQNIPHTVVVGRGWDGIGNIGYTYLGNRNGSPTEREQINYILATVQLLLTACISILVCFGSKLKQKIKPSKTTDEIEILKNQNKKLQDTVDKLVLENDRLLRLKKLYESSNPEQNSDFPYFPEIDISSLAISDEKTQNIIKEKYAEDMYKYVKFKLQNSSENKDSFEEANAATEKTFVNEQLSLFDAPPLDLPYLDFNSLAFADEETAQQIQKKYAEELYAYIKDKICKEA